MSMAIGHFALGACGALLALRLTRLYRRTTKEGGIAILSGLWAMLPDVGSVLPMLGSTDESPLTNLFWGHYWLDSHAVTESMLGNAALVALMTVSLLWYLSWGHVTGRAEPA